jgi:hypothetical protein
MRRAFRISLDATAQSAFAQPAALREPAYVSKQQDAQGRIARRSDWPDDRQIMRARLFRIFGSPRKGGISRQQRLPHSGS